MKRKLIKCQNCNDETWHMVGKKQATNRSSAYIRRTTNQCMQCGDKEINNKHKGKRILRGKNEKKN